MESFTIVDAGVAVIVLVSAILAYSRGFVREVFAILGWVAAGVLAYMYAEKAAPLVKQIPVIDKFLADNCELAIIAGLLAVFAGALIVASIITPLMASIIQRSALSGIDQGLGFLFGAARGILLVAVALLLYNKLISDQAIEVVDKSRSLAIFSSIEGKLAAEVPSDVPSWFGERYNQLVGSCGTGTTAAPTVTEPAPAPAPATP